MQSLIEDDVENICYMCGCYGDHLDVHHIFEGYGRRACSDRRGLIVHLCRGCHSKLHDTSCPDMQILHEIGQKAYEEHIGTREQFREEFTRSYL